MPVRESEARRAIMITCGIVHDLPPVRLVGIARHIHDIVTVIDAFFTFVQKDKGGRRTWVEHFGGLEKNLPSRSALRNPISRISPTRTTHPTAHRHAPDTWHKLS